MAMILLTPNLEKGGGGVVGSGITGLETFWFCSVGEIQRIIYNVYIIRLKFVLVRFPLPFCAPFL